MKKIATHVTCVIAFCCIDGMHLRRTQGIFASGTFVLESLFVDVTDRAEVTNASGIWHMQNDKAAFAKKQKPTTPLAQTSCDHAASTTPTTAKTIPRRLRRVLQLL